MINSFFKKGKDQVLENTNMRSPYNPHTPKPPIVIAHRGASGYRLEHTLEAYKLAIASGADFIEPDLVATKDGILVARHENEISTTTDISNHPEYRNRLTTKIIDGREVTGWFTEDFTLKELKTLKTKERLPEIRPDNAKFDGLWEIPTLLEIIDLVKQQETDTGRRVGIYPETKHPTYFDRPTFIDGSNFSLSLEELLIETLIAAEFTDSDRIFIQSFEVTNLKRDLTNLMNNAGINLPLIQLINDSGAPYDLTVNGDFRTYQDLLSPAGLREIANYATGIGPSKYLILPIDENNNLTKPTCLVKNAHDAGLLVHVWTIRHEKVFLANDYQNDPKLEYQQLFQLGVDGYFTDFPEIGSVIRKK